MRMYLVVALGGAIGAMGRHLTSAQMLRLLGGGFPHGTLAVNIAGAFAMGILVELLALRFDMAREWRAFLTVGVLGGFTTFSAFSLEVVLMIERNEILQAGLYALLSVVLCVAALFAGLWLIRTLV